MPTHGSTAARGYGAKHQRLRAEYQRRMDAGEQFNCPKCARLVNPRHWDLGHMPGDKTRYWGPQHVKCNRDTSRERSGRLAPRRWAI